MTSPATAPPKPEGAVECLRRIKIAPVIVIDDPMDAVPLAAALTQGGLPCAEVTLRTSGALEALQRICQEYPQMLAGAGTVLSPRQAADAISAGAQFVVAPGFSPAVVDYCLERGVPVFPGVCTPTEIEAALQKGLRVLKFFPAEPIGGLAFLKAISGPYTMVEFIPTGGINLTNLTSYLAFKRILACGGSWMAPTEWIAAKQFERIRSETQAAVTAVREMTPGSWSVA